MLLVYADGSRHPGCRAHVTVRGGDTLPAPRVSSLLNLDRSCVEALGEEAEPPGDAVALAGEGHRQGRGTHLGQLLGGDLDHVDGPHRLDQPRKRGRRAGPWPGRGRRVLVVPFVTERLAGAAEVDAGALLGLAQETLTGRRLALTKERIEGAHVKAFQIRHGVGFAPRLVGGQVTLRRALRPAEATLEPREVMAVSDGSLDPGEFPTDAEHGLDAGLAVLADVVL